MSHIRRRVAALLYDHSTGQKAAVAAIIPPQLLAEWGDSEHCIDLIEQAALVLGILGFKDTYPTRPLCPMVWGQL